MKKKKFNGKGAEECKQLDWSELSEIRNVQKTNDGKVSEESPAFKKSSDIDLSKSKDEPGEKDDIKPKKKVESKKVKSSKSSKKKSKKPEDEGFDIEDVKDGFDIEFDENGRLLREDEFSIRKSVDEKIIIKSEELKKRRSEKGFWKKFSRQSTEKFESNDNSEINFRDKKGLDKYRKAGVLPTKNDGPSNFRRESANWRDGVNQEVGYASEGEEYMEMDDSWWGSVRTASKASCMAMFMAVVLFVLSIMTTCAYADYRGAQNKWAALDVMPQYKETKLPSYSDRQIDTLEVEMLEAAGRVNQEHKILSLVLTSVEKDLKIKLVDDADTLVKNKHWGVVIEDGFGDESTFEDDDMDGIIHITGMSAGDYSVHVQGSEDLEGYEYPTIGQAVSVKSKVEYRVIANIRDEIKKESEVDVELEDPNGNQAADEESGEALVDTVEWVESSQSEGSEGYEEAFVDLSMTERLYAFAGELHTALDRIAKSTRVSVNGNLTMGISMIPVVLAGRVQVADGITVVGPGSPSDSGTENSNGYTLPTTVEDFWDQINDLTGIYDNNDTQKEETTDYISTEQIKSVTIDRSSATIPRNGEIKLNLTYSPSNAIPYSVKWDSSDSSIAAVVDGTVVGIAPGAARITAVVNDNFMVYCNVTVTNSDVEAKVSISGASTVGVGESVTLEANCSMESDSIINWFTQNTGVISMSSNGNRATITGLRSGSTTITAESAQGISGTITISVVGGSNREYADGAQLYDSNRNRLYVYEDGDYRLAKYRDYISGNFSTYYRKCGEILYTGWQTINGFTYYFTADHEKVKGEQVIGGVSYNFDEDGALSKGEGTLGIDVSKYQPSINWESVKASGISYVIIRCGYRGAATGSLIQDPYFTSHIRGAKNAGLKVGVYFFSTALNETEAVEEASMCAELCSEYGINYPIFLDVESSSRPGYNSLSVEHRTANIKAFCETIESAGYTPGLYANKTWLSSYIDTDQLNCKIWLAQYNSKGPTYRGHYDLWQFTSKGRVDGIEGNVDMNQSYLDYD